MIQSQSSHLITTEGLSVDNGHLRPDASICLEDTSMMQKIWRLLVTPIPFAQIITGILLDFH